MAEIRLVLAPNLQHLLPKSYRERNRLNMTHYRLNLGDAQHTDTRIDLSFQKRDNPNNSWAARKLGLAVTVHSAPNEIATDWQAFEQALTAGRAISTWCLAWYKAHTRTKRVSPFIVVGRNTSGDLEFVLPLEQRCLGPLKVLVAPGAGHTTYYAGVYSERVLDMFKNDEGTDFWEHVLNCIGKVDAILIEGFSVDKFGPHHPLALLPHTEAAHGSMRMDISSNWAAQYEKMITPKLKADDRRCAKRLSELGELKHYIARTRGQRHALLDVLLQQKATQFAAMNVVDPFKSDEIIAFYRELIDIDADQPETSLYFSALTLDGAPLAANFGLLEEGEMCGLITSMTDANERRFSPGRLLLGYTNNHLSDIGAKGHDFGMGMLPYKSVWCQRNIRRLHVQIGFSLIGKLYLWQKHSVQLLKNWLKTHDGVKRTLKRILHVQSRIFSK